MVMLDGDVVREIFNNDLGHEQKDRIVQIKRLQNLSVSRKTKIKLSSFL